MTFRLTDCPVQIAVSTNDCKRKGTPAARGRGLRRGLTQSRGEEVSRKDAKKSLTQRREEEVSRRDAKTQRGAEKGREEEAKTRRRCGGKSHAKTRERKKSLTQRRKEAQKGEKMRRLRGAEEPYATTRRRGEDAEAKDAEEWD